MQQHTCTRRIAVVSMSEIVNASIQRVQQLVCAVTETLAINELNKNALLETGTLRQM